MGTWKTFWLIRENILASEEGDNKTAADEPSNSRTKLHFVTLENETSNCTSNVTQQRLLDGGVQSNQSSLNRSQRMSQKQLQNISKSSLKNKRHRFGITEASENHGKNINTSNHKKNQAERLAEKFSNEIDSDSTTKIYVSPKTNRKVHFNKTSDLLSRKSIETLGNKSQSGRDSGIEVGFDNPEWLNITSVEIDQL